MPIIRTVFLWITWHSMVLPTMLDGCVAPVMQKLYSEYTITAEYPLFLQQPPIPGKFPRAGEQKAGIGCEIKCGEFEF